MPSYAQWNTKAGQNVSCWLCEHFQRYDFQEQPESCEGECRKNPPQEARDVWNLSGGLPGDPQAIVFGYCTYIFFGNTAWCNGFQVSLEDNIPPSPGALSSDCLHTGYDEAIWPHVYNNTGPAPYSKKPIADSCWYCNHFQRRYTTPTDFIGQCAGYCHIKPPERFYNEENLPPQPPGETVHNFVYPLIPTAAFMWCSRWERHPDADQIPDPPDAGTGPCDNLPTPP